MTRRARLWTAGVLLVFAQTGVVAAQGGGHGHDGTIEQARMHMDRGQDLYVRGQFAGAAHEFEEAYAALPTAAFLYNAGLAYEHAGEPGKAADFFARYLERDPNASDAASVRARVEALRTQAVSQAAEAAQAAGTANGGTNTANGGTDTANGGTGASANGSTGTATNGGTGASVNGTGTATNGGTGASANGTGTATNGGTGASVNGTGTATNGGTGTTTNGGTASTSGTGGVGATASTGVAGTSLPTGSPTDAMKSLLAVRTNPEGAHVTVTQHGQAVASGLSPLAVTLDEGAYHLDIEHTRYHRVQDDLRVAHGKVFIVIVAMSQGQFLGYLHVVSQPPGARVFLDNQGQGAVGQTPFLHPVPTGVHHLWIEQPGYTTEQRSIHVPIGTQADVHVNLHRVAWGKLHIVANVRPAHVYVDDRDVGTVPYDGQLPGGTHALRVEADGMKTLEGRVEVARGQLTEERVHLRPAEGRGEAWVSAILGAALVGGGAALGVVSNNLHDDLAAQRDMGRLAGDDSRLLEGKLLAAGADLAFGIGALFGVLAVYQFLRDPLPDSSAHAMPPTDFGVDAAVGPDAVNATVRGAF